MRCSPNLLVLLMALAIHAACVAALAQTPGYSNVGRAPSENEIRDWDIAIGPQGKELPPGSGTAKQGATIFAQKCAPCHGQNLEGTRLAPALVGGKDTLDTPRPVKTVASYWPFATTVWDYINRAMPRNQVGSLQPDEVYAVTAFVLHKSDIIKESDLLDAQSLPKVQMPNRNGFVPPRLEDIQDFRKRGCRLGNCP